MLTPKYSLIFLLLLSGLGLASAEKPSSDAESKKRAQALVETALKKLGGADALTKAGGVSWTAEGEFDLAVRMQGMTAKGPDRVSLEESFAYIPQSNKTAYETHAKVNPDADEWMRYLHDGAGRLLIVNRLEDWAIWDTSPGNDAQRTRYARIIPHLLLQEALRAGDSLQLAGEVTVRGQTLQAASFSTAAKEKLKLLFDQKSGAYQGLEYLVDYPLWGDTPVRWLFSDYQDAQGLGPYPMHYQVLLGDRILKSVRLQSVSTDAANAAVFAAPEKITIPEPPKIEPTAAAENAEAAPSRLRVSPLADNVHLVINVRDGFHVLVIEFKDFVAVVDTPAGYHEFQQIPAIDWANEKNSRAVGDRLLETVRKTVKDKPVRYVVLTHHHSDHTGGIRPFIEAGAKIVVSAETAAVIRNSFGRKFTLESPKNPVFPKTEEFEIVQDAFTISDGETEAKVINVGKNPHVAGMLVVYLPGEKLLYQADLFEPINPKRFPNPARTPIMKWFVAWLDQSGLKPEKIYAIHGAGKVSEEHLEKIRNLSTES